MFKANNLISDEVPLGGTSWTPSELAQLKDYMGEAGFASVVAAEKGNGASAHAAPGGIGHNSGEHEWSATEIEAVEAGHASIVPIPIEQTTFAQQIGAIVHSDYAAIDKLVMLSMRLHANHKTLGAPIQVTQR
jgi:hypothetical protein